MFVAGSTGFAPIKAMIEQQLALDLRRDMILFWGAGTRDGLYEIDEVADWTRRDERFWCVLAVDRGELLDVDALRVRTVTGSLAAAIAETNTSLAGRDAYIAGPPAMMPAVTAALRTRGMDPQRITVDSFGL